MVRSLIGNLAFLAVAFSFAPAARSQSSECFDVQPWRVLSASNEADGDLFGAAVAVDADTVWVGAPNQDSVGVDAGMAYVFRTPDGGATWYEEQQITAIDGAAGDAFGVALALQGSIAVVGAPYHDASGVDSGAVYVYRRQAGTWTFEQKLMASDAVAGAGFGRAVDCQSDVIVVGAPGDDALGADSGAAYVFRFQGGTWVQEAKLTGSDGASGDRLGQSVSFSGDVVVAGAPFHDHVVTDAGAAYAFRAAGSVWSEEQELLTSTPSQGQHFGATVCVDGIELAVDASLNSATAVCLFRFSGSWQEIGKIPFEGVLHAMSAERLVLNDSTLTVYSLESGAWFKRYSQSLNRGVAGAVSADFVVTGATGDPLGPELGLVSVFSAHDLALIVDPRATIPGSAVEISVYCALEPGTLLAAVAIDGSPVFGQIFLWQKKWIDVYGGVPAGLSGHVFTLQAYGQGLFGGMLTSDRVDLRIL